MGKTAFQGGGWVAQAALAFLGLASLAACAAPGGDEVKYYGAEEFNAEMRATGRAHPPVVYGLPAPLPAEPWVVIETHEKQIP